ncbi:MAG: phosphoenolpyruvate carboxykinase (ATP), partial [Sphingobacteriaceae bacterium]
LAGTETGVLEPKATFSACFGAPFLPLAPERYAALLGKRLKESGCTVWLINTGWIGGAYGVGTRIPLQYSRTLIHAVLNGGLASVEYQVHPVLGLHTPLTCPGVPQELLNPYLNWKHREEYEQKAQELAAAFTENYKKYESSIADDTVFSMITEFQKI